MKSKSNFLKTLLIGVCSCVCSAAMVTGIFAAQSHNIGLSTSISFSACGVIGTIKGYTDGLSTNKYYNPETADGWSNASGQTDYAFAFDNTKSDLPTWAIGEMAFQGNQKVGIVSDITISFVIENNGENAIGVTFSNLSRFAVANLQATYTLQNAEVTQTITSSNHNVYFIVGSETSEIFTITLHVINSTKAVSIGAAEQNCDLSVNLAKAGGATVLTINQNFDSAPNIILNVPTNSEVVLPKLIRSGYEIDGYKINNTGDKINVLVADSSKTLYAQWKFLYTFNPYVNNKPTKDATNNITYEYYMEMGEYPQIVATNEELISIFSKTSSTTNGTKVTLDNGDKFVYLSNSLSSYSGANWFKIEPVRWIVLGTPETSNGNDPVLFTSDNTTNWKFENNKFYTKNGSEWKTISESELLLISEKTLVNHSYDSITSAQPFKSSEIYGYMNTGLNSLTKQIFTSSQQAKIASVSLTTTYHGNASGNSENNNKLFLLAHDTTNQNYAVTTYFANEADRASNGTNYAFASGLYNNGSTESTRWWLRSGYSLGSQDNLALYVDSNGYISFRGINEYASDCNGIRPCFVLNVS